MYVQVLAYRNTHIHNVGQLFSCTLPSFCCLGWALFCFGPSNKHCHAYTVNSAAPTYSLFHTHLKPSPCLEETHPTRTQPFVFASCLTPLSRCHLCKALKWLYFHVVSVCNVKSKCPLPSGPLSGSAVLQPPTEHTDNSWQFSLLLSVRHRIEASDQSISDWFFSNPH